MAQRVYTFRSIAWAGTALERGPPLFASRQMVAFHQNSSEKGGERFTSTSSEAVKAMKNSFTRFTRLLLAATLVVVMMCLSSCHLEDINTSLREEPPEVESINVAITRSQPELETEVLIQSVKQGYLPGEAIQIRVTNSLDTSITTFDQQAFCSFVSLEQRTKTQWTAVRNCLSGVPPSDVILPSGADTLLTLLRSIGDIAPGMYHATMVYSPGKLFTFRDTVMVASLSFHVH